MKSQKAAADDIRAKAEKMEASCYYTVTLPGGNTVQQFDSTKYQNYVNGLTNDARRALDPLYAKVNEIKEGFLQPYRNASRKEQSKDATSRLYWAMDAAKKWSEKKH